MNNNANIEKSYQLFDLLYSFGLENFKIMIEENNNKFSVINNDFIYDGNMNDDISANITKILYKARVRSSINYEQFNQLRLLIPRDNEISSKEFLIQVDEYIEGGDEESCIGYYLENEHTDAFRNMDYKTLPYKVWKKAIRGMHYGLHSMPIKYLDKDMLDECLRYDENVLFSLPFKLTAEIVDIYISNGFRWRDLMCIPKEFITKEIVNSIINRDDWGNNNHNLEYIPKEFITKEMIFKIIKISRSLSYVPEEFLTNDVVEYAVSRNIRNCDYIENEELSEKLYLKYFPKLPQKIKEREMSSIEKEIERYKKWLSNSEQTLKKYQKKMRDLEEDIKTKTHNINEDKKKIDLFEEKLKKMRELKGK